MKIFRGYLFALLFTGAIILGSAIGFSAFSHFSGEPEHVRQVVNSRP